jgi:CheY-like chemotaxis protein
VVAQKLVKKLCPHCREVRPLDVENAAVLHGFTMELPEMVAHPVGCPACRETGYLGREGVYEVLRFDPTLSEMVRSGASINRIRAHCIERGDYMMYHHAVDKVGALTYAVADAHEQVLLEELRFRQASTARTALGLEGEASAARVPDAPGAEPTAPPARRTEPVTPTRPVPAGAPSGEAPQVLLAEDDLVTSKLVEAILKAAGYRVTVVSDGVDALLALGQRRYDAIVSDLNMPNLGGLELLGMLNTKGVDIPVLFMTGEATEDTESEVLAAGAEDFIRKPIRPDVLVGRVKNAVRRSAARS